MRCPKCTGRFVYSFMWLGMQTVSSLERSPLFSVLHREIPLYLYVIVIDLLVHDVSIHSTRLEGTCCVCVVSHTMRSMTLISPIAMTL